MNAPLKFCPHCGAPITKQAKFCNHCGFDLTQLNQPTDETLPDPPTDAQATVRTKSASSQASRSTTPPQRHFKKGRLIAFALVLVAIFLVMTKPWIPKGFNNAEQVVRYSNRHANNQIGFLMAAAQLNDELKSGVDHDEPRVVVLRNKKSGRFVFKLKSHYVYLIRLLTDHGDAYYEVAVAVKKGDNGKVYHHQLSKSEMTGFDDITQASESWSDTEFDQYIDTNH